MRSDPVVTVLNPVMNFFHHLDVTDLKIPRLDLLDQERGIKFGGKKLDLQKLVTTGHVNMHCFYFTRHLSYVFK